MEWEDIETPDNFLKYGNGKFAKTMKMWAVQKYGYEKGSPLEPGLVCRGGGFTDSPDAEFISEGNHTKSPGKVALGRHGNFFHWGYSGAPKHMTEQGKKVFINAIHYIAKFKGQRILSKKVDNALYFHKEFKSKATKDFRKDYVDYCELIKESNEYSKKQNKDIKERMAAGKEVSDIEKMIVNRPPEKIPTAEEYAERYEADMFAKFGLDYAKWNAYYKENADFMRSDLEVSMAVYIDEDAKKIGKSFYADDFLPYCIKALKDDAKKDIALTLLKRYTLESFDAYKAWSKWYKKNKKRLFFTEAGGCKYMINIYK